MCVSKVLNVNSVRLRVQYHLLLPPFNVLAKQSNCGWETTVVEQCMCGNAHLLVTSQTVIQVPCT